MYLCMYSPLSHEFNSYSKPTLDSYSNFISLFSVHVLFRPLPLSVITFSLSAKSRTGSHMSAAE